MGGQRCRALSEERTVARLLHLRPSVRQLPSLLIRSLLLRWGALGFEVSSEPPDGRTKKKLPRYFLFSFRSLMYVRSNSVVSTLILRATYVCGCVHNVGLPPLQIGHACLSKMGREGERNREIVVRVEQRIGWGGNMEGKSGAEGDRGRGRGPARRVLPGSSLSELYRLLCSCRGARRERNAR